MQDLPQQLKALVLGAIQRNMQRNLAKTLTGGEALLRGKSSKPKASGRASMKVKEVPSDLFAGNTGKPVGGDLKTALKLRCNAQSLA
jgi:hypothetical protein